MAAPATVNDTATQAKPPVHSIRYRGVSASVFENTTTINGHEQSFHKVAVSRSYKDGDVWKSTTSFGRNDLPVLTLVLNRAYEWILDAEAKRGDKEGDEDND